MANDWWLAATTPDGVHLYPVAAADDARTAAIAAVRTLLGFPADDGDLFDSSNAWQLGLHTGRPACYFQRPPGNPDEPIDGVTVHLEVPGVPVD